MAFGKVQRRRIFASLLALSVVMPLNSDIVAGLGHGGAALLAALRDPAALIAGRSPGSRGTELIQTKPPAKPAAEPEPTERVLADVRERPEVAGLPVIAPNPPQFPGLTDNALPDRLGASGMATFAGAPGEGPRTASVVPTLYGGGGGGGGGPVVPTTPPSAVPEPATWMLMIVGIFGVGIGMRRDQRRRRSHAQAAHG